MTLSAYLHDQPWAVTIGERKWLFNLDGERFCVTKSFSEKTLDLAIISFEQCLLQHTLSTLTLKNEIALVATRRVNRERFALRYITSSFLLSGIARLFPDVPRSNALRSLESLSLEQKRQLCKHLQEELIEHSTEKLDFFQARVTNTFLKKTFSFDVRLQWTRAKKQGMTARQFLEILCDTSAAPSSNADTRSRFNFLQHLNAYGVLLLPIGLARNCLSQRASRGTDPQRYLDNLGDAPFASDETASSLSNFYHHLPKTINHKLRASLPRIAAIALSCTTAHRFSDCPTIGLKRLRLTFETLGRFHAKKPESRADDTRTWQSLFRYLTTHIEVEARDTRDEIRKHTEFHLEHLAPDSYLSERRSTALSKRSGTFDWLVVKRPPLAEWATHLREYSESLHVRAKHDVVTQLNCFCDWLLAATDPPTSPRELSRESLFAHTNSTVENNFLYYLQNRYGAASQSTIGALARLRSFANWLIDQGTLTHANPIRSHDIPVAKGHHSSGKTNKVALPSRVLDMMKTIIMEDDKRWSKSIREDWICIWNGARHEEVWCPVRSVALYTLLTLPLRSKQLRLLDSGELDEHTYSTNTSSFQRNTCGQKGRRRGVIREIRGGLTNDSFPGFFISSNKWVKDENEPLGGYEISWDHRELRSELTDLIEWQAKYNPIESHTDLNDLSDTSLHVTSAMRSDYTRFCFLFRDPCTKRTYEPISRVRLESFLHLLLAEVEKRISLSGEELQLITEWTEGRFGRRPTRSPVTLHSLRVSGITQLAEAGVPLHILSEFIAGHASIIMNLYYQKSSPAKISEVLTSALENVRHGNDMEAELDRLRSQLPADIQDEANFERFFIGPKNSHSALTTQPSALWSIEIDGICPNGRSQCDNGGPTRRNGSVTEYEPVPGGPGNCSQCRHWITGPMFLPGLVVTTNTDMYRAKELGAQLEEIQRLIDNFNGENEPSRSELARLRGQYDRVNEEIHSVLSSWVSKARAIQDCIELANDRREGGALALIDRTTNVSIDACNPHELRYFVSKAAEVIPGRPHLGADREQTIAIDNMLAANGIRPFLFSLDRGSALNHGNAIIELLTKVAGSASTEQILRLEEALPSSVLRADIIGLLNRPFLTETE